MQSKTITKLPINSEFFYNFILVSFIFTLVLSYSGKLFAQDAPKSQTEEVQEASDEMPIEESADASFSEMGLIQILNKITAKAEHLKLKVGKEVQFGKLDIILHKCWKSPSFQAPENKMLVEVFNRNISQKTKQRIFFGWIFSSSPSLSGLEHPIYDITALKCLDEK